MTYLLRFHNGKEVRVNSEAEETVMRETGYDQAPADLLPAELYELGPEATGVGKLVRTFPRD